MGMIEWAINSGTRLDKTKSFYVRHSLRGTRRVEYDFSGWIRENYYKTPQIPEALRIMFSKPELEICMTDSKG
jgi:hypothetical protein